MVGTGGRAQAHSVPRVVVVVFVLMAVLLARLALLFVPGAPGGAHMLGFGFAMLWPEAVLYLGLSLALAALVPSWRGRFARSTLTLTAGATTLHVVQLGWFLLWRGVDAGYWTEHGLAAVLAGILAGLFVARLAPREPVGFALAVVLVYMTTPLWKFLQELGFALFAPPFAGLYRWTWATILCLLPLPTTVLAAWLARRRVAVPPASA